MQLRIALAVIVFVMSSSTVSAWTGPTATPPGNNASTPLNVSSVAQVKNGNIGVNGLAVFGNTLLQGGNYLNFGPSAGSAGYGFWDNAGILNFKDSGGSWESLQAIISRYVGNGQWLTSGSNIYNSNAGNVGIGTVSPTQKLDVTGNVNVTGSFYLQGTPILTREGNYNKFSDPSGGSTSNIYLGNGNDPHIYARGTQIFFQDVAGATNYGYADGTGLTSGSWLRSTGNTGWYSNTWGSGLYMADATWIRTFGTAGIWAGTANIGSNGGITMGYSGANAPAGGAILAGNVGIGNSSPTVSLDVSGGVRAGSTAQVTLCGLGIANGEGTQRYDYSVHSMQYCNGTTWVSVANPQQCRTVQTVASRGAPYYDSEAYCAADEHIAGGGGQCGDTLALNGARLAASYQTLRNSYYTNCGNVSSLAIAICCK